MKHFLLKYEYYLKGIGGMAGENGACQKLIRIPQLWLEGPQRTTRCHRGPERGGNDDAVI